MKNNETINPMNINDNARSLPYSIIWIGILVGIGFIVADIIIDVYVFRQGALIEEILNPTYHEIWMRACVFLLAVAFAIYVRVLLSREHQSSERAKTAETFLTSVFDNIPNMVFIKDAKTLRFVRVNHAGERLLGLTSRELLGKNDFDVFPGSQAEFFVQKDREVLASGIGIDIPEEDIDTGLLGRRWLHTKKVPILDDNGQPVYLLGISEDITEARQAEIDREKNEIRFQTLFNFAAEFIFVIDPDGTIIEANHYACEHSGYGEDEITGRNIKEFFTRESQHTCDCNFPGLRERGYNRADIEFVHKDGHIIDMECSAAAVPDTEGNFNTFLIIQRDVTERNHVVAALSDSERRFRAIFNSAFQYIGLLDPDGIVLEANQTVMDFLGCTKSDLVGKPFWEVVWMNAPPGDQERARKAIREARQGKLIRYQVDMVGKDNTVRTVDLSLKPVQDEQGETILIIPEGRDITDLKLAEEELQLRQQELAHVMRLNTMGEMASGMAHELNQPLTALVSYCGTAEKLAKSSGAPQELNDILVRASEQAHRAGDVLRYLRGFVSKGNSNKTRIVLDDLVHSVIDFISWELRNTDIQVTFQTGADGCGIVVDKVQIEQVLINLVRNSIDAIREAGISNGQVDIATRLTEDGSFRVTVTDNGPGIDPAIADSLFEPYQTSKETGMGMGLSISRSIIEAHNGKLWADIQRQQGAVFHISMPGCE
jgi:PAS domain S-box-containing protein